MDLASLFQSCIDGVGRGGFSVIGSALAATTIKLVKTLLNREKDPSFDEEAVKTVLSVSSSESLAKQMEQRASSDQAFSSLLSEWKKLAVAFADKDAPALSAHNKIHASSIANSVISQRNSQRARK